MNLRNIIAHLALCCVVFFGASPSTAQSDTHLPACITNVDANGTLYSGYFGVVAAPNTVDSVIFQDGMFDIFPSIRFGVSVFAATRPRAPHGPTPLLFLDAQGEEVFQCQINVTRFEPQITPLDHLTVGTCPVSEETIPVGGVLVQRNVRPFSELAIAFGGQIDLSPFTSNLHVLLGLSAGVGQVSSIEDSNFFEPHKPGFSDGSNSSLMGLCPIRVIEDETALSNVDACLTQNNEPAILNVGQEVILQSPLPQNNAGYSPTRAQSMNQSVATAEVPRPVYVESDESPTDGNSNNDEETVVKGQYIYSSDIVVYAHSKGSTQIIVVDQEARTEKGAGIAATCMLTVQ